MGVSPAITAGAAVSGAMLGDKTARISDTALLTIATVGGIKIEDHSRMVLRTAIPAVIVSALLYLGLGFFGNTGANPVDPAQIQDSISQYFNVSLLAFLPIVLVVAFSALRFSAFISLMLSAIAAAILAAEDRTNAFFSVFRKG